MTGSTPDALSRILRRLQGGALIPEQPQSSASRPSSPFSLRLRRGSGGSSSGRGMTPNLRNPSAISAAAGKCYSSSCPPPPWRPITHACMLTSGTAHYHWDSSIILIGSSSSGGGGPSRHPPTVSSDADLAGITVKVSATTAGGGSYTEGQPNRCG